MTKVLLLGEYSALHKYLKEGLLENGGCEVVLAANGDGWKKIDGYDMPLFQTTHKSKVGHYYDLYLSPLKTTKCFTNYDVVQFINHRLFATILNYPISKRIIKYNNCISLVSAGDDLALVNAYREGHFEYFIYDYDDYMLKKIYNPHSLIGRMHIKSAQYLSQKADVIIPSLYQYSLGYEKQKNLGNIIPFPINIDEIEFKENKVGSKIVFFHGLNRELSKGSPIIKKAMERVKHDYPNEVEIVVDGHMPFQKYLEVIDNANVIIDQCLGYGYGINTCISLAKGKIVMTSCRKETLLGFGIEESPIIYIAPSVEDIYQKMVWIIENKSLIKQLGFAGRQFVGSLHDYRHVAELYMKEWKKTGKI